MSGGARPEAGWVGSSTYHNMKLRIKFSQLTYFNTFQHFRTLAYEHGQKMPIVTKY